MISKKTGAVVFFGAVFVLLSVFGVSFFEAIWSFPRFSLVPLMVVALLGTGIFTTINLGFPQIKYLKHGIKVTRGDYDDPNEAGDLNHFQALTTALSATVGIGNIAGVATAIYYGGPGALFWMWVTAIVGVSTKFYTASLSVMYRHQDLNGQIYGGPMYVIINGMGKKWYPLAALFAGACMIGALPVFQANQFVQLLRDVVAQPLNLASQENHFLFDLFVSFAIALLVFIIIRGKIYSIGSFAVKAVPLMVVAYLFMTFIAVGTHFDKVLSVFRLIIADTFSGSAVAGGSLATVIMIGVRRGAFSNEAGIGTESMAHGTAKTREPIREGLVAMLGPVIDTLIMCCLLYTSDAADE